MGVLKHPEHPSGYAPGNEFEVHKPRLASRMAHRDNPPANTAEDYYRVVMYDEFLSHIISELEERFVSNTSHKIALGLLYLLPTECVKLSDSHYSQ